MTISEFLYSICRQIANSHKDVKIETDKTHFTKRYFIRSIAELLLNFIHGTLINFLDIPCDKMYMKWGVQNGEMGVIDAKKSDIETV